MAAWFRALCLIASWRCQRSAQGVAHLLVSEALPLVALCFELWIGRDHCLVGSELGNLDMISADIYTMAKT